MFSNVETVCFQGIDVASVDVQIQISSGLPVFSIVGLPNRAVIESRDRVRAALQALGLALPPKRIIINLAPANLQKEGTHYDLPIALGLLCGLEILPAEELKNYVILGELSLNGKITAIAGVLSAALYAGEQGKNLICPEDCGAEAAWCGQGIEVLAPQTLLAVINHFKGTQVLAPPKPRLQKTQKPILGLQDIKGQDTAKRVLKIAAAGGHNLLMVGPPGVGKSMLASCLPGLLPPLNPQEALEATMIHSLARKLEQGTLLCQRPFRSPHHSASMVSLIGGGARTNPGEVSLAHQGILFLDELPEFSKSALEALRQPLETGKVSIARADAHVTYPARFQLIATMNPCACGQLNRADQACRRAPLCGEEYTKKISGPLRDRIDLHIEVPPLDVQDLDRSPCCVPNQKVDLHIKKIRDLQRERIHAINGEDNLTLNGHVPPHILERIAVLTGPARNLLIQAVEKFSLSARGYHKILRTGRTISDLEGSEHIQKAHVAEALSYRLWGRAIG